MSKNGATTSADLRSVLVACILAVWISSSAVASNHSYFPCAAANESGATQVHLNSSLRGYSGDKKGSELFEVDVQTGVLIVDVGVPGPASVAPRIEFLGRSCASPTKSGFAIIERFTDHLVLAIRMPGTYSFHLTAEDPSQQLGEYTLTTGFVSEVFTKDGGEGGGEEDPEEIELLPDPLVNGFDPRSFVSLLRELCRLGRADDHNDTYSCATRFRPGSSMAGDVRNSWVDDHDLFVFKVDGSHSSDLQTISIETVGDTDTFGTLYDRRGLRLKSDDDGGTAGNFRIVKTLPPGVYYVRVEGTNHAEGSYSLSIGELLR